MRRCTCHHSGEVAPVYGACVTVEFSSDAECSLKGAEHSLNNSAITCLSHPPTPPDNLGYLALRRSDVGEVGLQSQLQLTSYIGCSVIFADESRFKVSSFLYMLHNNT
jgi:hypothetical protein